MMGLRDRLARMVRAFRPVFANRDLRRIELAFLLFGLAKGGLPDIDPGLRVRAGRSAETGLVAAIQLFPAAVTAPFASVLGARLRRDRALDGSNLEARGRLFTTVGEIGPATGMAFLGGGLVQAAAEPTRRGGGSAMVEAPAAP